MAWSPKYLIASGAVLAALLIAAWGTYTETKIYTCKHTYSRKRIERGAWCFIARQPTVTIESGPNESPTALHDWWLQSTVVRRGPGGIFGSDVDAQRFEFSDGSRPERLAANGQ